MRKAIVIVAIVLAAGVAFLIRAGGGANGRDRVLRRLNETGTVIRRSCGLGEAYVDGARWRELDGERQQEAAAALASWCADQGGAATLTLIDSNTRTAVARWNGTSLEPGR